MMLVQDNKSKSCVIAFAGVNNYGILVALSEKVGDARERTQRISKYVKAS